MRVQSERAKLVRYLRVFVKFVLFRVENFIFNGSFEVCVRTNRSLPTGYLQTGYDLTSLHPLYYTLRSLFKGSLWIDLHVSDIASDIQTSFLLCFILKRLITIHIFCNRYSCQQPTSHIHTGCYQPIDMVIKAHQMESLSTTYSDTYWVI